MLEIKNYHLVTTLDEAYKLNQDRNATVLGGACWLKYQSKKIEDAIDLSNLGLDTITEYDDRFEIGAMTTLRDFEKHEGLKFFFGEAISKSMGSIVGVQFRNCATIGGSLFMRFGFSDIVTILMAFDSYVELYNSGTVSIEEFNDFNVKRDIITKIIIKKEKIDVRYFHIRNASTDFPVINGTVTKRDGKYIAVVGSTPHKARRVSDINNILANSPNADSAEEFAKFVVGELQFGDNSRASKAYREHVAKVLVKRAIMEIENIDV